MMTQRKHSLLSLVYVMNMHDSIQPHTSYAVFIYGISVYHKSPLQDIHIVFKCMLLFQQNTSKVIIHHT